MNTSKCLMVGSFAALCRLSSSHVITRCKLAGLGSAIPNLKTDVAKHGEGLAYKHIDL